MIRPFVIQDRCPVIDLWMQCGLTRYWNDPDLDIDRKLRVQPELFLVKWVGNELVATVMAGYDGHRGWLNYLGVLPPHRGRGYARELVQTVEHKLLLAGCPKLNLQVRTGNQSVVDFYQAIGYGVDDVVSLGKRLIPD